MNRKHQFAVPTSVLQSICDLHRLGHIATVEWAGRGMNNPVLIINDRFVLRFDGLNLDGRSRFHGEKVAYDCLREQGIPAPRVIALDTSKTLVPQDYMVMSKIEGQAVIDRWPDLTSAQREQVAYEAGRYLAMMHEITFQGHGQLRQLPPDRFPTWYDYVVDYLTHYGNEGVEQGIFSTRLRDTILATFERNKLLLSSVTPARLVHWDYHFENIMEQDGHVSGILDFEWALSGDPNYDFKVRQQWEETCPGSREALYRGYTDRRALPPDHETRVALYCVMMFVDYAVDARTDDEREEALAELQAALDLC